jgi:hypothetical protein
MNIYASGNVFICILNLFNGVQKVLDPNHPPKPKIQSSLCKHCEHSFGESLEGGRFDAYSNIYIWVIAHLSPPNQMDYLKIVNYPLCVVWKSNWSPPPLRLPFPKDSTDFRDVFE